MNNSIIIKIESGIVVDIFSTAPLEVTIVDYDMIEGGESFAQRTQKAVLSMTPEQQITPEQVNALVKSLILGCVRPADRHTAQHVVNSADADALAAST